MEDTRGKEDVGGQPVQRGLYWVYWIEYSIFSALGQPEDGARPTGRFDKGGLLADVTSPSDVSPRYEPPTQPNHRTTSPAQRIITIYLWILRSTCARCDWQSSSSRRSVHATDRPIFQSLSSIMRRAPTGGTLCFNYWTRVEPTPL